MIFFLLRRSEIDNIGTDLENKINIIDLENEIDIITSRTRSILVRVSHMRMMRRIVEVL